MSISSGIYRFAQAIKWGGRLLAALLMIFMAMHIINTSKGSQEDWLFVMGAALILGVTHGISWILEGFAQS